MAAKTGMENINYKGIPNCLKRYRRARGLKQSDVARILGLKSTSMVSRWEKGVCLPSTLNLFKLAALYRTMTDAPFISLLRAVRDDMLMREEKVLKRQDLRLCQKNKDLR